MNTVVQGCPYVGLAPYTEAEREYFFGRERDVRVIAANIRAARLTVLYGASGVGKSSVLLAGVVPRLAAARRTAVVVVRDWQRRDPLSAVRVACLPAFAAASAEAPPGDELSLDEFLGALAAAVRGSVHLVLDQFDEYLVAAQHPATQRFEAELAKTVNRDDLDVTVLISLRDDALSGLDRFRARIPNLLANTLRLEHLDLEAAREAIRRPLELRNARLGEGNWPVTIEDDLVEGVLAQVRTGRVRIGAAVVGSGVAGGADPDRVETPFLQLVLTRIWSEEIRRESRMLRRATFDGQGGLGGAQKIVTGYFDGVMAALGPDAQEACARFFDRLVTPSGNKVAYAVDDLSRHAGDLGARVPHVLKALSDARLLRHVPSPPDQPELDRYEIFHDVMAPAVLQWQDAYLKRRQRVAGARRRRRLFAAIAALLLAVGAAGALAGTRGAGKRAEQLGQQLMTSGEAKLAAAAFARSRRFYRYGLDSLSEARAASSQRDAETVAAPWGFLVDLRTSAVRELHGDVVRIGRNVPQRALFNDISFPDRRISRRHLEIRRKGLYVEDQRTTNGTTLNARFLEYGEVATLRDGDLLVLGGWEAFRFRSERPDDVRTPPPDAWGLLLDGGSRSVEYLSSSLESVVAGQVRIASEHGHQPSAVLWVQQRPDSAQMYGRAIVFQDLLVPGQLDALFSGIARQIVPPDRRRELEQLLSRGGYPIPARWVQLSAGPMATRVGVSPTDDFRWFQLVPLREASGF